MSEIAGVKEAVNFMARRVRETQWFNVAFRETCKLYPNVAEEDILKEFRRRQSDGQRRSNARKPPRKYHWYAVEFSVGGERNGSDYFVQEQASFAVQKATTESNAISRTCEKHDIDPYSEYGAWCHFGRIEEFDNESNAVECVKTWKRERQSNDQLLRSGIANQLVCTVINRTDLGIFTTAKTA